MLLFLLSYMGGVLTIISPCILPVLPFVFSRAGQSFTRSGLPMLAGMALMFSLVATLAAVGGNWVVTANQYGRFAALIVMALFALTMLMPSLADRLARPFVAVGNRLTETHGSKESVGVSFLLGIATGLLWAPCAGPILGLILSGAALQGASVDTTILLVAYAAGAATSLALALFFGGKVFSAMKVSLGAGQIIRRLAGAAMLIAIVAIGLGWDTGALKDVSLASTNQIEEALLSQIRPQNPASAAPANAMMASVGAAQTLADEGVAPSIDGAVQWLNSPPLTMEQLRGKVVLIDFWTYSCINCIRALPYVKQWAEKYKNDGLVVIGVHAPEFAFERDIGNVNKAIKQFGLDYPVAVDNNYAIWRAYKNQYWPAHYFIDAQGYIRYHHFGEGEYDKSERVIQQLLREAGRAVGNDISVVNTDGVQKQADMREIASPETYLGYGRAEHFVSGPAHHDQPARYQLPATLALNQWGLTGQWQIGEESIRTTGSNGRISFRFKARDVHLVLGPDHDGKPVAFKVTIDGKAPVEAHGTDIDEAGRGTIREQRLYQLIRQAGAVGEHTVDIEFEHPGATAYAFTFG